LYSGSQSEEVNYMGNQGKSQFSNNPYPNFYNQRWRQISPIMVEGKNMEHQVMDLTNTKTHHRMREKLCWKILCNKFMQLSLEPEEQEAFIKNLEF